MDLALGWYVRRVIVKSHVCSKANCGCEKAPPPILYSSGASFSICNLETLQKLSTQYNSTYLVRYCSNGGALLNSIILNGIALQDPPASVATTYYSEMLQSNLCDQYRELKENRNEKSAKKSKQCLFGLHIEKIKLRNSESKVTHLIPHFITRESRLGN